MAEVSEARSRLVRCVSLLLAFGHDHDAMRSALLVLARTYLHFGDAESLRWAAYYTASAAKVARLHRTLQRGVDALAEQPLARPELIPAGVRFDVVQSAAARDQLRSAELLSSNAAALRGPLPRTEEKLTARNVLYHLLALRRRAAGNSLRRDNPAPLLSAELVACDAGELAVTALHAYLYETHANYKARAALPGPLAAQPGDVKPALDALLVEVCTPAPAPADLERPLLVVQWAPPPPLQALAQEQAADAVDLVCVLGAAKIAEPGDAPADAKGGAGAVGKGKDGKAAQPSARGTLDKGGAAQQAALAAAAAGGVGGVGGNGAYLPAEGSVVAHTLRVARSVATRLSLRAGELRARMMQAASSAAATAAATSSDGASNAKGGAGGKAGGGAGGAAAGADAAAVAPTAEHKAAFSLLMKDFCQLLTRARGFDLVDKPAVDGSEFGLECNAETVALVEALLDCTPQGGTMAAKLPVWTFLAYCLTYPRKQQQQSK
jgi:hypothetical protein